VSVRIDDPYAVPGEYRKAQLHCHTTESDGRIRPRDLLRMYKDAGYSFVLITDHNRVTRCDDLNDAGFLALPGSEDTVSSLLPPLGPHLGRLFVETPTRSGTAQERIDVTVAAGGLASLCHPTWTGNFWTGSWPPGAATTLLGYHLIEVWNPHSSSDRDVQLWSSVLRARGSRVPAWGIAVDDCHHARQFNRGWVMAKVTDVFADALKRALTQGAFYASTGVSADFGAEGDAIWARWKDLPGAVARYLDAAGAVRLEAASPEARYRVRGDEGFARVEVVAPTGARAWSQPFRIIG
jgi:hypothetical protein